MGNGENIKIWEDPWLPRGTTRRPITMRRGSILTRAAELLNPVTGQWDEEMVTSTFWSEDVPTILVIPVHMEMDDVTLQLKDNVECIHLMCAPEIVAHISRQINKSIITVYIHHDITSHSS
jgi:hypothetical protein